MYILLLDFLFLSGFVITHLLIKEIKQNNSIDLVSFYKRRILRIWPLYFFYLFICLIYINFEKIEFIWYYVFMIANWASVNDLMIPLTNHYWSLAVEEQFYVFWPFFLIFFYKRFFTMSICFILILFLIKFYLYYFSHNKILFDFFFASKFDFMAIGGIIAFLVNNDRFKIILSKFRIIKNILLLISLIIILLVYCNSFYIHKLLNHYIYGFAIIILIFESIINNNKITNFRFIELNGKISFGIYVYHIILLDIVINRIFKNFDHSKIEVQVAIIFVCIVLIYLVSYLSFNYFEKYFNDLRAKLKRVH
ncbi:MAG: acyltransferase [Flavobacteriales bacterium]|nr:acyltransferase [Flavobacteriales bacterium]